MRLKNYLGGKTDIKKLRPFHLAFPVSDLNKARFFYKEILGCLEGRTDTNWVDFNFFGHQITAHKIKKDLLQIKQIL